MKKTVQINIAGIIFFIEEDAYHALSTYLHTIQTYFSSYEGSQEIIQDIEARIAEKFFEKQKLTGKSAIEQADIDQLIASMGTVADFEAIEEEDDFKETSKPNTPPNQTTTGASPKRIFRDVRRKAVSGVLAGISHYFSIDVTWTRIIFLLLFLGLSPVTETGLSGILFIAYFVCWVAFPPSMTLEEDKNIKKFYRNPENQVVGGVASGLATYFGLDVAIVRLLFVLGIFLFGTGFVTYIILWIVSPKANSLTQKMEMKGQPVTLENIENNVKQNLQGSVETEESTLTRLVLLPFRAISLVLSTLGQVFKRLGPVVRIFIGLLIGLVGLSWMLASLVGVSVFWGFLSNSHLLTVPDFPTHVGLFISEINPWIGLFGFLVTFLPALALVFAGLALITNKSIGNRPLWLTGLGIWVIGILGASIIGTNYSLQFARQNTSVSTENFILPANTLYLDTNKNPEDEEFESVRVTIETSPSTRFYVEKEFEAKGATRDEALANARAIGYGIQQKDSSLIFDEFIQLSKVKHWRDQQVRVTLFIPAGKKFKMTEAFYYEVFDSNWRIREKYAIDGEDIDQYTFTMSATDGLQCLDCPVLSEEERQAMEEYRDEEGDFDFSGQQGMVERKFQVGSFSKIDAGSAFKITVRQGTTHSVVARAEEPSLMDDLRITTQNDELSISFDDVFKRHRGTIWLEITVPTLTKLDLSGATTTKVLNFKALENLQIELSGASKLAIDAEGKAINADISGASQLNLKGKLNELTIDASGASRINAIDAKIANVRVEASGASNIELGTTNILSKKTSGASQITQK